MLAKRCRLKQLAVERVKWIVSGKVVLATPPEERVVNCFQRQLDAIHRFHSLRRFQKN